MSENTMFFHWNCTNIAVVGFFTYNKPTTLSTKKPSSYYYKAATSSNDQHQQQEDISSFAVSYLVNSCGLSPQAAVSVATKYKKRINFHSCQNPDSVLALLREHGFSQTHISKLVRYRPSLLSFNPERTLLPKIQFLTSIGISGTDLPRIISSNPTLLASSLEKQLIPCYNFLKTVAHLEDKQVIIAFKRRSIISSNILTTFTPNVALLRQLGVPQSAISFLFTTFPQVLALKHSTFVKAVEETNQMGFDPSKNTFVLAIYVLSTMTDSKWESKFEIFGKWGWSMDDTIQAFTKCPLIMNYSDKKITQVFDFLVNKMGWPSASKQIAHRPTILTRSLDKNIVPKCYVIHVLQLKGLMKEDVNLSSILTTGEKYFLERYVTKFEESVPQLLNLYKGKVDLIECIKLNKIMG